MTAAQQLSNIKKQRSRDIHNNHAYHPPQSDRVAELHELTRRRTVMLSLWFNENLPEGREKDRAIELVREAMMWANAAIACKGDQIE